MYVYLYILFPGLFFIFFSIPPPIPFSEFSQPFAERGGGFEPEIGFQGAGVGVGDRHVAGLHGYEFLVRFEVVVGGENLGADEFFLENRHEVEQVFRVVVADIVDLVGRERESVFAVLLFGCVLHHADDAFDDVVDVGEVALALAVIEYLDGLAGFKLVGEAEVGHVRAAGGAVDGKEAEARARNVVELAVGVCHELVALFGGCVQRYRIVDLIIGGVRDLLVAAVHAGGTGVHEVFDLIVTAGFQDIVKADEVALDIGIGVRDGIADAGLGGEVHDDGKMVLFEDAVDGRLVGEVCLDECPLLAGRCRECFDFLEAFVLDVHVIVIGNGVEANEFGTGIVGEQLFTEVTTDKACGSCHKDRLSIQNNIFIKHYIFLFSTNPNTCTIAMKY